MPRKRGGRNEKRREEETREEREDKDVRHFLSSCTWLRNVYASVIFSENNVGQSPGRVESF